MELQLFPLHFFRDSLFLVNIPIRRNWILYPQPFPKKLIPCKLLVQYSSKKQDGFSFVLLKKGSKLILFYDI